MQPGPAAKAEVLTLPNGDTDVRALLDDGRLRLVRVACLPVHGAHLSCSLCIEACPVAALTGAGDGSPQATEACVGCGRCAAACPTGALSVAGFALKAARGVRIALDCSRVPPAEGSKQVRCLGGLTVEVLLELASIEARPVLLDRGWCASCAVGAEDAAPWSAVLAEARALLAEAGGADDALPTVETLPLPPAKARPVGGEEVAPQRRALLRQMGLTSDPDTAPLRHSPDTRRREPLEPRGLRRRLNALRTVVGRTGHVLPAALRPALSVAESCDGQFSCVAFCPTGALHRTDIDGTTAALAFDASTCITCGRCAEGCAGKALRLTTGPVAADGAPEVLRTFTMTRCRACGAEFPAQAGEERCSSCRVSAGLFLSIGLFGGR